VGTLAGLFGLLTGIVAENPEPLSDRLFQGLVLGLPLGLVTGLQAARTVHGREHAGGGRLRRLAGEAMTLAREVALSLAVLVVPMLGLRLVWLEPTDGGNGTAFGDWALELLGIAATLAAVQSLIGSGLSRIRGTLPVRTRWHLSRLPRCLLAGAGSGATIGIPVGAVTGLFSGISSSNEVENPTAGIVWSLMIAGWPAALGIAVFLSVLVGLPIGVGRWLTSPIDEETTVTPRAVLRSDTLTSLIMALVGGVLAVAVTVAPLAPFDTGTAVVLGFFVTLLMVSLAIGGGPPWAVYTIARCWLAAWRRLPWSTLRFLESAHEREILRQVGAVYQFRHDRLESHLATTATAPGRRWPAETREHETGRETVGGRPRWRRTAEAFATVVVLLSAGLLLAPGLREDLDDFADELNDRHADILWLRADELEAGDTRAALHLRIAAAELGNDDVSRRELGAFLRVAAAGGNGRVVRLRGAAYSEPWLLTLDRSGLVQAWDNRAAEPSPIELGRSATALLAGQGGAVVNEPGRSVFWDLTARQPQPIVLPVTDVHHVTGPVDGLLALDDGTASVAVMDLRNGSARMIDLGTRKGQVTLLPGAEWLVIDEGQGTFVVEPATGRRSRIAPPDRIVLEAELFGATLRVRSSGREDETRDDGLWDLSVWPVRRLPYALESRDRLSADGRWLLQGGRLLHRVGPAPALPHTVPGGYGRIALTSNGDLVTVDAGEGLVRWDLRQPAPRRSVIAPDVESHSFVEATPGGFDVIPTADAVVGVERDAHGAGRAVHYDLRTSPPTRRVLTESVTDVDLSGSTALVHHADLGVSVWDVAGPPRRIGAGSVVPEHVTPHSPQDGNENWIWASDVTAEYLLAVGSPRTVLLPAGPYPGSDVRRASGASWAARFTPSSSTMWHRGPRGAIDTHDLGGLVTDVFPSVNGRWAVLLHLDPRYQGVVAGTRELMMIWRLDTPMPPDTADPIADACARLAQPLTPSEWEQTAPGIPYRPVCAGKKGA
jgi:hypothetical protein